MKLNKLTDSSSLNILLMLLFISHLPIISACQSKELSRTQAQTMITANDNFRQIVTLNYINKYLKEAGHGTGDAKSEDEPEAEAIQDRINAYYWEEPRVQIANFLGLVEPHLKRTGFKAAQSSITKQAGFFYFDETWTNTAKGKKLWADYEFPAQETTVPLARRELVQITGITKIDESQRGVDFTWKWSPNELGKALDPLAAEFKALPDNIQKNLLEKRSFVTESLTYNWAGDHSGKALFRKFDDGWHVEWVTF